MNFADMVAGFLPLLGSAGNLVVQKELEKLSDAAQEPWQKTVLALMGDAIEKNGPEGIKIAQDALGRLAKGKPPHIDDFASLETASDFLATLQNAEKKRRKEAHNFAVAAGKSIGTIMGALVKGLVKSAMA